MFISKRKSENFRQGMRVIKRMIHIKMTYNGKKVDKFLSIRRAAISDDEGMLRGQEKDTLMLILNFGFEVGVFGS